MAGANSNASGQFIGYQRRAAMPAGDWKLLTFSDTDDFDPVPRAIRVSADCTLKMLGAMQGDAAQAITLPVFKGDNDVAPRRIFVTGSDAVSVWGLY